MKILVIITLFLINLYTVVHAVVDSNNSIIAYPSENAFINNPTPELVGFVKDSFDNPVANQTIILSVDNHYLDTVVSDENGMWSYIILPSQTLTDGNHSLTAFIQELGSALSPQYFTIDTVAPEAPIITVPIQNSVIEANVVTVSGATEPYATITVFIDNDADGQKCSSDETGFWTLDTFLAAGNHVLQAQAEDLAFNIGPLSNSLLFSVNTL